MKQFSSLLILVAIVVLYCRPASAQVSGDNIFLPGHYVEIGIAPNGSLGSTVSSIPVGYFTDAFGITAYDPGAGTSYSGSKLAMIFDAGHDGWTVGTPPYFGDYTLPGTPFEGWSIEINGARSNAWYTDYQSGGAPSGFDNYPVGTSAGLTGNNTSYTNALGQLIAVWDGTAGTGGALAIKQVTELDTNASWMTFSITLRNTGGSALTNVYYMRSFDPDNDSYAPGGSSVTTNTINFQNDYAHRVEVTAAGTLYTTQTLAISAKDCRAKVFSAPTWPNGSGAGGTLANYYTGTAPSEVTTLGPVASGDVAMGIVFNIGTIAAGDSAKFTYAYVWNGSMGLDSAISDPQLVTLGVAHDTTDTVTSCAFSGPILPVSIINGATNNWTNSTWTWAPSTGLSATTGLSSSVDISGLTGVLTYTITGVTASAYGSCNTKTFLLTVTPAGPPPPPLVHDTSYCQGGTAGPLTAIGPGLMWYTVPTGGTGSATAPIPSTVATGATTYYVSQTIAGCLSPRAAITVTIIPLPSVIAGPSLVCPGSCITETDATPGGTWSSANTGIATVSTTGTVCGVSAGTATISYSVSSGCSITKIITVIALPPPISGTLSVCQFAITPLSAAGGGAWSSSVTTIATVGTSGTVTGVTPGTSTITYSIGTGCNSTAVVTVNPAPAPIGGTLHVCAGLTTHLTDITTGGTWISSNPPIASVGSATGLVTASLPTATSFVTITYTAPGGCTITAVVTINPLPGLISGATFPLSVCGGAITSLTDFPGGGTWSSSNTLIATVGSSTGITGGVSLTGGSATITYTLSTGCDTTATLTVAPLPGPITGVRSFCAGLGSTTLSDASPGGYWQSNNTGIANIDPFSGVVTGGSTGLPGVDTITYTTTCTVSTTVTVNPAPPPITGPASVCVGAAIQLLDAVTGGTWSSSNTALASVGATTGIVTGGVVTTPGLVTITYTAPSGCSVSTSITIYPAPGPILGNLHVCAGQTTALTDPPTAGTWMSVTTSIAIVTPGPTAGGITTGVIPGTDSIIFIQGATGCTRIAVVTVNSAPGPITGTPSVCIGSCITLSNATTGGTWSSSNGAVATAGLTTGVICGSTANTSTITYSLGGTCVVTVVVTVHALPAAISGTLSACVGATTSLTDAAGAGTWSSSNTLIATVGPITSGIVYGASPGTSTITYTPPTGCSRTAVVTINAIPGLHTVTGGGSYCSGGTSTIHIGLDGSTPGVTYTLHIGGATIVGTPLPGTGSALDFGIFSGAGTYTVTASSGGCTSTMTGSATITINPAPTAFTVTGTATICPGGSTPVGLSGSATGISYQLFLGGVAVGPAVAGTGGAITFGPQSIAGTYIGVGTNIITGCTKTMTGSAVITISPTPVISGPTTVCAGASISESVLPLTGGTWLSGATSVATVVPTTGLVSGVAGVASGSTATITYTSAAGCTATTVVTVSSAPGAISGANTVCVGATTTESDIPTGGAWSPATGAIATVGSLSGQVTGIHTGTVTITYSLGSGCTVTKIMTVTASPAAILGSSSICAGTTTILTDAAGGGTWSSSNTAAATVNGTGVVSGITPGTSTIIYTLGGCTSSFVITVNAAPGPITGVSSLCSGGFITLSDAITGGSWTSSNTTVATVDGDGTVWSSSTSGAGGTATITYSLGGACVVTKVITVNAISPVTGSTGLCVGSTSLLSATPAGGTWGSSNSLVATVSATGIVTALPDPGTSMITYTTLAGCTAGTTVTVNTAPGLITGTAHMCAGLCTTLGNSVGGGTWSSSNTFVATLSGPSSGNVCGTIAGTSTITYSLGFGCITSVVVTVNGVPSVISGTAHVCAGSCSTLSDGTPGGAWSSSNTGVATVSATGLVCGTAPGTSTITYAPGTGCAATAIFTVNAPPVAIAGGSSVCQGSCIPLTDGTAGGTWSSSSSAATAGVSSGIICGVTPGITTITYSLGPGCTATQLINILPPPSVITGPPMVCVGQSVTLTDTTTGGTWSSGAASLATIGSASGVLSGVSSGTVVVSYTVGTGCTVVRTIIVNALSPVIGDGMVCQGLTITLTDTTGAGTWSSSNTPVATAATAGVSTGLISGVTPGTSTITYTLPTGCAATATVTVNPAPPAITGDPHVCSGATTTLSDGTAGGSWSSGNTLVATVSPSGVVTGGTATGATTITYTVAGTGCPAVVEVTVNGNPPPVSGPSSICLLPGNTITLSDALAGGVWSVTPAVTATIDPVSGILSGLALGSATVAYTLPGGCAASMTVAVNAPPPSITGPQAVCEGLSVLLSDAATGGTWGPGNSVASVDAAGNVTGLTAGTATISYTTGAGCSAAAVVTVNAQPGGISGATTLCQGAGTTLTSSPGGGTWSSSDTSVVVIDTFSGTVATHGSGSATVTFTTAAGCSVTATVLVNPSGDTITGSGIICQGSSITLTETSTDGTWSSSNTVAATIDPSGVVTGLNPGTSTISFGPGVCAATLVVTVNAHPGAILGASAVCAGSATLLEAAPGGGTWSSSDAGIATAGSSTGIVTGVSPSGGEVDITYSLGIGCTSDIIITVNPLPAPITGPLQICNGASSSVPLTDDSTGGAWSSSNTAVFINAVSGTFTGLSAGTSTITYTLPTGCITTAVATVNVQPAAITGLTTICLGSTRTLNDATTGGIWTSTDPTTASVVIPSAGVIYGQNAGTTTIIYTIGGCSAPPQMVTVVPLPFVYTVTGGGSYCAGGAGVDITLNGSASGVNYLLYHGATATGTFAGTGSPLDFGLQGVAGPYTAIAVSTSTGCTNIMGGSATVTITPTTAPTVSISAAPGDTVCAGTSTTFMAIPFYGGTAPAYVWNVNGVAVSTGSSYTFIPAEGDVVSVTLTSDSSCALPATAGSATTMTVLDQQLPVAGLSVTPGDTVCQGGAVTLTALPVYGGYGPTYNWMKNGIFESAAATYTYVPANGDTVYVSMTSNYLCRTANTVQSNKVGIVVDTPQLPLVTITAKPGTSVAIDEFDTLTASVVNGGINPHYQWVVNELPVAGATTSTYISNNFRFPNEDSVTCVVTSDGACSATSFGWLYVSLHPEGVATITGGDDISILPNPNKGEFMIRGTLGTATDEEVSVEITDMLGQVVYREKVMANSGKLSERIELGKNIANGMYLLNLKTGSGNRVFHIVVEQ